MNLQTMMQDIRFIVFGNSSNTDYSDTDIKRNINKAYRYWLIKALKFKGWQIRGTYAEINLIANTNKYSLSNDILKFSQVLIKNNTADSYQIVKPIDINSLRTPIDEYKPANPEYDLRDGYITIYWSNSINAVLSGLKLYVQRDITELENNTDEPDFPEAFVDLINLESAKRYCIPKELRTKVKDINDEIAIKLVDFNEYLATRDGREPVMVFEEENLY